MSIIAEKLQLYPDIDTVGAFLINCIDIKPYTILLSTSDQLHAHSSYLQIIYPA